MQFPTFRFELFRTNSFAFLNCAYHPPLLFKTISHPLYWHLLPFAIMLTHSRDQRKWLKAAMSMGVALALLNSTLNKCMASPTPQLVFYDIHAAHNGQQQSVIRTAGNTVLDVLGERPEFSKLLELIQKDKGRLPCDCRTWPLSDMF